MTITARRRSIATVLALVVADLAVAAAGTSLAVTHHSAAPRPAEPARPAVAWKPPGPHGGVDLKVLVVTDGSPPVEAIRGELAAEGLPVTVINLKQESRRVITAAFLARATPVRGGNFEGIVLPSADPAGLSAAELRALSRYEKRYDVREVDAYTPPMADVGMTGPVYSGPLSGAAAVTARGARAGFGYLNRTFPFSGGVAGQAPFGYLADPLPGTSALVRAAIPGSESTATLVWQFGKHLGIGFPYASYLFQFRYLAHGIISWLTKGINLGDYRNYLDLAYDDMFLGDSQWSIQGKCTPGITACPKGTPMTATIRMNPADVTYLVQWEKQHDFKVEFLYNGGASARFAVNGTDALLTATRPVAKDFYWVNHTYTHAYFGCEQDFSVVPWKCVTDGGQIQWAAGLSLISSQIEDNFSWARQNEIPYEPGVVASGEYSGLRMLPQQPVDNPNLAEAMTADHIKWIAMDASREPAMRPVGAALGVPRIPIDIGEDADTVAEEVSEFNWYNDARADGGSGACQDSEVTQCLKPLSTRTGFGSTIVPGQVQIVLAAMLGDNPRPVFMHQSNLTGDRIAYPVMNELLSAYRAVFSSSGAPVVNLPMSGCGAVLRDQRQWASASRSGQVSAWVDGHTLTISGPPGAVVPVTVPDGTTTAHGTAFGSGYAGGRSAYTTLGPAPLTLTLPAA